MDENTTLPPNLATLALSEAKQEALIGHMLVDERLFRECKPQIKPEWFVGGWSGTLWKAMVEFWDHHEKFWTLPELKDSKSFRVADQATRNGCYAHIIRCQGRVEEFSANILLEELTNWLQARMLYNSVKEIEVHYQKGQFDQAIGVTRRFVREVDRANFGAQDRPIDFTDFGFFDEEEIEAQNALTFGNDVMDQLLLKKRVEGGGGLVRGDLTVIIAPTNVGKTTFCTTIARHNVMRKRNVLMITHEGRKGEIVEKFWCGFLGVNAAQLTKMRRTPEGHRKLLVAAKIINRYFKFVPMVHTGQTVEEVVAKIQRLQDQQVAEYGEGFDLVVDDYPAKLNTNAFKKGSEQWRHKIEEAYQYFADLGLEYNWHTVAPIQTNRIGSKVNKRQKGEEKRLVTLEDVAESYGSMTVAANIVSLNRSPEDERNNIVTFLIDKSRGNAKGVAVVTKSAYDNAITHDNKHGAVWYYGHSHMMDNIRTVLLSDYRGDVHEFIRAHANQELPLELQGL